MKPKEFQLAKKEIQGIGWDHFVSMDKYFFLDKEAIEVTLLNNFDKRCLWVLKSKDSRLNLIDSVSIHGQKMFLLKNKIVF